MGLVGPMRNSRSQASVLKARPLAGKTVKTEEVFAFLSGAGKGARTLDLRLGKATL